MEHLNIAFEYGLRAIGPAHYGPGTYAHGTNSSGGLGLKGRQLLDEIEKLNLILDVTHLCDLSFWETIDHYLNLNRQKNLHSGTWAHKLATSYLEICSSVELRVQAKIRQS